MTDSSTTHASDAVVDVHAHLVPIDVLTEIAGGDTRFPNIEVTPHESTYRVAFNGEAPTRPIAPGLSDPARRTAWLDEHGIDLQVVGGWLDIFGYQLPTDEGTEWSSVLTDGLRTVAAGDERLVVLGTVPLQAPDQAAEMLRLHHKAGLPGAMIATRAAGRDLDDPPFTSFWEAADETGSVIFLHPGFGGAGERYHDFGLVNGLARLEDTTVTLARLLYAGIPAKYPNAKILVAHAGAALPYVLGRLAQNHAVNPDSTADPLESFSRLYFDSVVFDSDALRFLLGKVGAQKVLLGSDYPFPIGDLKPRNVIKAAELDAETRVQVEGGNARELFLGGRP